MNTIFTILKGVDTRSNNELKKIEKQTNNIAWYPSAGLDFRDVLELSNPIYKEFQIYLFTRITSLIGV